VLLIESMPSHLMHQSGSTVWAHQGTGRKIHRTRLYRSLAIIHPPGLRLRNLKSKKRRHDVVLWELISLVRKILRGYIKGRLFAQPCTGSCSSYFKLIAFGCNSNSQEFLLLLVYLPSDFFGKSKFLIILKIQNTISIWLRNQKAWSVCLPISQ